MHEAGSGKAGSGPLSWREALQPPSPMRGYYRLVGVHKLAEYTVYVTAPKDKSLIGRSVRVTAADAAAAEPVKADAELMRGVVVTGRVYDKATDEKGVPSWKQRQMLSM